VIVSAMALLMASGQIAVAQDGPIFADDASRLNRTKLAMVWSAGEDVKSRERQLAGLLRHAREHGLRVSIGGARHTMGAHTLYPCGILINMLPWNQMELNAEKNILTVGAGALWKDIIPYLDAHGRSVAVMQSNNSFSVGGSLSANCHGWQFHRPPIASTVESFRLMLADGRIVNCSRTENPELFSLALGGYGLLGVILDARLRVVPNQRYRLEQYLVSVDQSLATFDQSIQGRPGLQLIYARMSVAPNQLLEKVVINAFFEDPKGEIPPLGDPRMVMLRRAVFRGSAQSELGKQLRWAAETKLQPLLTGKVFSRNQLLNEGVEVFQNRSPDSTDILHEYFVPRRSAADFVQAVRTIVARHRSNLLNVTVRDLQEDTDTFLRYADRPMMAFVMLFEQPRTQHGEQQMQELTEQLIDAALTRQGRFYLPYRLHATDDQFHRAYPQAQAFFEKKRQYDPGELFQNGFYVRYARPSSGSGPSDGSRQE
jgi:FAD/FMN-containing dehydrogenase